MGIEYISELPNCPICGKAFYVSHDMPDGYDFGWSGGCCTYFEGDGVHPVRMARFNMPDKNAVINWWLGVCDGRNRA